MKRTHLVAAAAATVLFGSSCSDERTVLGPATSEQALLAPPPEAARAAPMAATGAFEAIVDFETLTATPVGGTCLLEVEGELDFSGTLEGVAPGRTTAWVFASCPDVLANPPGTFADVFKSVVEFDGTVNGEPARARLVYFGRTEAGGHIDAWIRLSNGLRGVLQVDAELARGGAYDGFVIALTAWRPPISDAPRPPHRRSAAAAKSSGTDRVALLTRRSELARPRFSASCCAVMEKRGHVLTHSVPVHRARISRSRLKLSQPGPLSACCRAPVLAFGQSGLDRSVRDVEGRAAARFSPFIPVTELASGEPLPSARYEPPYWADDARALQIATDLHGVCRVDDGRIGLARLCDCASSSALLSWG